MKPIVNKVRNIIIDQNPNLPISVKLTAQGKRYAISKSKIMNNIATK